MSFPKITDANTLIHVIIEPAQVPGAKIVRTHDPPAGRPQLKIVRSPFKRPSGESIGASFARPSLEISRP